MKVKLKKAAYPSHLIPSHVDWKLAFAFNANPRGILVHRIKSGRTHSNGRGEPTHDSVDYWCGGSTSGEGVSPAEKPPKERLLCSRCEGLAVAAGEPSSQKLAGRHVHIGELRAFRLCCRSDNN